MSPPRSPPLLVWFGVVSFLASGCGGATSPPSLASSYDMVSYESNALPTETRAIVANPSQPEGPGGYRCSDRLMSVNLQFHAGNTYTQVESRLLVCDDGRADLPSSSVVEGTHESAEGGLDLIRDLGSDPIGNTQFLHSFARLSGNVLTVYRREVRVNGSLNTVTGAPLVFVATR